MTTIHTAGDTCAKSLTTTSEPTVLGRLARVQTSMSHGVCLLIDAPSGPILVPLAANTQSALEHALQEARQSDNSVIGSISSLSVH